HSNLLLLLLVILNARRSSTVRTSSPFADSEILITLETLCTKHAAKVDSVDERCKSLEGSRNCSIHLKTNQ
ncbi:hypothetical protein BKA69DRAFT_1090373, partial [Paraphysoderma sedebokerense]